MMSNAAVIVIGCRGSGKTTLAQSLFPDKRLVQVYGDDYYDDLDASCIYESQMPQFFSKDAIDNAHVFTVVHRQWPPGFTVQLSVNKLFM